MEKHLVDIREVADLLYKKTVEINEETNPIELLKTLQAEASETQSKIAEDKYKYGFKQGSSENEKLFKSALGLELDLKGQELADKIAEDYKTAISSTTATAEEITKIKSDYTKRLKDFQDAQASNSQSAEKELLELKNQIAEGQKQRLFNERTSIFLQNKDLNLSGNEELDSIKIKAYRREIAGYNLKHTEHGTEVLGEDGTPLLDSLNRPVTFEEINKQVLSALIGYKSASSAPNLNPSSGKDTAESIRKELSEMTDTTSEEYRKKQIKLIELSKNY